MPIPAVLHGEERRTVPERPSLYLTSFWTWCRNFYQIDVQNYRNLPPNAIAIAFRHWEVENYNALGNPRAMDEAITFLEKGYSKQSDDDPIFKKSPLEML